MQSYIHLLLKKQENPEQSVAEWLEKGVANAWCTSILSVTFVYVDCAYENFTEKIQK